VSPALTPQTLAVLSPHVSAGTLAVTSPHALAQLRCGCGPVLAPQTLAVLSPHVSADRPALGRGYKRTCAVRYVPSSSVSSSSFFLLSC